MPYKTKGKCVYKKDTGTKVGCTEGPVNDYLAALHANVNKESFDSLINQYLTKYLFEDAMASTAVSPTQPAKSNDPKAEALKKAKAEILKRKLQSSNRQPTQGEVEAFAAGQESLK